MKKIDIGQTLSIIANFGVVIGIFFLAVEIQQNQRSLDEQNALSRQSARDRALADYSRFRVLLLQDDELLRLYENAMTGQSISESEWPKFRRLCQEDMWIDATTYVRFRSFDQPEAGDQSLRKLSGQILRSSDYRQCWEVTKDQLTGRGFGDFVSALDEMIASQ